MIVIAVIGLLAAIAIPKFANLMRKSKEGSCKGSLGSIRSALTVYYADNEGIFPDDLTGLTLNGKYLSVIPSANAADYHPPRNNQQISRVSATPSDFGGWFYDDIPGTGGYGKVVVNCTHTDTSGIIWSTY